MLHFKAYIGSPSLWITCRTEPIWPYLVPNTRLPSIYWRLSRLIITQHGKTRPCNSVDVKNLSSRSLEVHFSGSREIVYKTCIKFRGTYRSSRSSHTYLQSIKLHIYHCCRRSIKHFSANYALSLLWLNQSNQWLSGEHYWSKIWPHRWCSSLARLVNLPPRPLGSLKKLFVDKWSRLWACLWYDVCSHKLIQHSIAYTMQRDCYSYGRAYYPCSPSLLPHSSR